MIDEGRQYELVGDLLDQQIVDSIWRPMGMVDGIVLDLSGDGPPRVSHLEVGGVTLARRLHNPLGRWLAAIVRRWGGTRGEPFRIPIGRVKAIELDVEVDIDADTTPAYYWEHRLGRVVRRLPGS
ncbi:MAG TPA: hypothetical protein VF092_27640 [Longimicrobium sp.]